MEITAEYKPAYTILSANMSVPVVSALGGYNTKILVGWMVELGMVI